MNKLAAVLALFFVTSAAFAQTDTHTLSTTSPGMFDDLQVLGGIHSWIDTGRVYELQDAAPKDRTVTSVTEYFFGVKKANGWGIFGQFAEWQNSYANSYYDNFEPGDPSITIMHPIYSSDRLKISGKVREYFMVSDWARHNRVLQQAYYLELSALLPHRWDLFNVFIPRYFSQPSYSPSDTTIYAEDWTYLGRPVNPWLKVGVGQHAQVESHSIDPVGKDWQVFPYANFMLTSSVFAGPRVYFPLYAQNSVYLGDKSVSLSNVEFEFYLQAHL